jgi:hypothetical protein
MENEKITLRGVTITKESLEEKYGFVMTEIEWKIFSSKLIHSWAADQEGLRKLAFNHIKTAMGDSGFKLDIADNGLIFKKIIEG